MFIKQSEFERQIKKAYKYNVLRIYCNGAGDIVIRTTYWILGIHKEFITKEIKGALIKLVGDLPEVEQIICYGKEEGAQIEFATLTDEVFDKGNLYDGCNLEYEKFCVTNVTIEKQLRVVQSEADINIIRLFNQQHLDLIDRAAIDTDNGEFDVRGPISKNKGATLKWITEAGVLEIYVYISEDNTNELIETLKTIRLERYEE